MPRQARKHSYSGYMHIITRGIGKQILFEDYSDFSFYLSALKKYSHESNVSVCAYCLMENHVHLLLFDNNGQISLLMKKIGVSYSQHYNKKYERTGHLFQDRYLSEPIENSLSLLTVFRYILNNPRKAGISPADHYQWSSYYAFRNSDSFVDTSIFEELFKNWDDYSAFILSYGDDQGMDYELFKKDDAWAKVIIKELTGNESGTILQSCNRFERDNILCKLKESGLTVRQIERLTGINRGVIQRA